MAGSIISSVARVLLLVTALLATRLDARLLKPEAATGGVEQQQEFGGPAPEDGVQQEAGWPGFSMPTFNTPVFSVPAFTTPAWGSLFQPFGPAVDTTYQAPPATSQPTQAPRRRSPPPASTPAATPEPLSPPAASTPEPASTPAASTPEPASPPAAAPEPVSTPAPTPEPASAPTGFTCSSTDRSAEAVHSCINAMRTNPRGWTQYYKCDWGAWINGITSPQRPALVADARLARSSARLAQDMAGTRTVSHAGSDGSSMAQRIAAEGFSSFPQAENVAGGQGSALEVAADWMCSEGHRGNIMSCSVDSVGTAVAYDINGRAYYAQDFGCSVNNACQC